MKQAITLLLCAAILAITFSSCSRYAYQRGGTCGVWYPKKYKGDAPKVSNKSYRYRKGF